MAPLAPISLAATIIGFISFSFTLAIWLHAFWDAFLTLGSAPHEIKDALSTLRQSLYEEREYLKRKRRRGSGNSKGKTLYAEGAPTKVINDAVKDLIREFKGYEAPFLYSPHSGREKELEWSFDATQEYYGNNLLHRLMWLGRKAGVRNIATKLQWIQTRRIAMEVTEMHFLMSDTMGMVRDCTDRLSAIEHRLQMSQIG
jgi:hypothetical protein